LVASFGNPECFRGLISASPAQKKHQDEIKAYNQEVNHMPLNGKETTTPKGAS
jgi:hypothetical protein